MKTHTLVNSREARGAGGPDINAKREKGPICRRTVSETYSSNELNELHAKIFPKKIELRQERESAPNTKSKPPPKEENGDIRIPGIQTVDSQGGRGQGDELRAQNGDTRLR